MILDLIGGAAGLAYMVLVAFAIYRSRWTASLRDLDRAVRLLMLAALAMFIYAAAWLMQVDEHGWTLVVLSVLLLAGTVGAITLNVWRADRMEGVR